MVEPTAWDAWIGRTEVARANVAPESARALAATLDHDPSAIGEGDALPLPWHWLYAQVPVARSALGSDGHPRRGGFLPPVPLARRMWAGSRLAVQRPVPIGSRVERASSIDAIKTREGRGGPLVIVTVHHAWRSDQEGEPLLNEWQDIVYCDPPSTGVTPRPDHGVPPVADWSHIVHTDTVLLMRYSALTFNSHRIHYDQSYATGVEGYPGLVVHGPLVATLLLDALRRQISGKRVQAFEFKALRPLICGQPITICGRDDRAGKYDLWACDEHGDIAMRASAQLE
jgi:3-methylfumaryl-CoA hydratase